MDATERLHDLTRHHEPRGVGQAGELGERLARREEHTGPLGAHQDRPLLLGGGRLCALAHRKDITAPKMLRARTVARGGGGRQPKARPRSRSRRATPTRHLGEGGEQLLGAGPGPRTSCRSSMGSLTLNVAPCPSPRLAASTLPPCSSTSFRTIASPMPRPPCARLLELSACRKRWNSSSRNAGAMPWPLSVSVSST